MLAMMLSLGYICQDKSISKYFFKISDLSGIARSLTID